MAKKKRPALPEEQILISISHPSSDSLVTNIVDTHTHVLSTYQKYAHLYPGTKYRDVYSFVRELYGESKAEGACVRKPKTEAIIDVWCEAPVTTIWKEIADTALEEADRKTNWGGVEYWFVMGVHPHDAQHYNDTVEQDILEAMQHPRCVGWGEIGLDYKVSPTPREVQHAIFERQLRHAVRLNKPITIHTREAEEDTERILKAEVPKLHPIHVHCYTDSPGLAIRLMEHFPNLYIGITGVITYSSNFNTSNLIRSMIKMPHLSLKILLETDAPYMIPANLYRDIDQLPSGTKLPLSHTGMIPWTAEWVAKVAMEGKNKEGKDSVVWDVERVMKVARDNARRVYGV
ncbi:hypothetical protein BU17DRAFT_95482 [Hysterangium stoloniferum]|nr:hypothetical protein BU17DRAFT_95482 [Hysterangium stoloniferum]